MSCFGSRSPEGGEQAIISEIVLRPLLTAALAVTGLLGRGRRNARDLTLSETRLEFERLPKSFEGFRILQISDPHIDGMDGLAETVAELVSGVEADLCVLTGDYRYEVHGSCEQVYARMGRILDEVRAPEGVLGIRGNHDPFEVVRELENLGVRMLMNEALELRRGDESLWIAGVDDPFYYRTDDLDAALSDVPPQDFRILLAHSPDLYAEAEAAGVDLYLCGHTHGGQIRLPGIGPLRVNARCPRRYGSGLWRHGNLTGYTSTGVGTSLVPVRFNCPPEIALIELARVRRGREEEPQEFETVAD